MQSPREVISSGASGKPVIFPLGIYAEIAFWFFLFFREASNQQWKSVRFFLFPPPPCLASPLVSIIDLQALARSWSIQYGRAAAQERQV